jgi:hypothetical protein
LNVLKLGIGNKPLSYHCPFFNPFPTNNLVHWIYIYFKNELVGSRDETTWYNIGVGRVLALKYVLIGFQFLEDRVDFFEGINPPCFGSPNLNQIRWSKGCLNCPKEFYIPSFNSKAIRAQFRSLWSFEFLNVLRLDLLPKTHWNRQSL